MAIIVAFIGAGLGVINAGWSIWRWRVDRTYVAWSFEVKSEGLGNDASRTWATFTNSGTATAYDVRLAVGETPEEKYHIGSYPHVVADRPFDVGSIQLGQARIWSVTWRDRPGKPEQTGIWEIGTNRSLKPSGRERLGARIAGKPIQR